MPLFLSNCISKSVATYPFADERGEAHGCVFHRRKMRGVATNVYWKENVRKTKGNRSRRIFQIRELSLRLRKVLAPLTFVPKDNNIRLEFCEIMYLNLYFFSIFEVDKSGALAPTYPPSKRKSNLRSSFKRGESSDSFLLGRWSFKALDLKIIHFTWWES